jgi:hypothetical protein
MLQWTEASASWSNRSTMATYEHINSTSFSTHLELTGGDAEPKEHGWYGPGNPRFMVPEDSRAEAASPGAQRLHS